VRRLGLLALAIAGLVGGRLVEARFPEVPWLAVGPVAAAAPGPANAAPTADEETVRRVAAQLRCVVCQNLSVLDSPSEMAAQMRAIIRERLAAGEAPEQVVQYFVDKYGEWILLSPREHGFNLLVWAAPVVAVLVGLAVVAVLLRRWTRPRARPATPIDPALRERIRRELDSLP
jgi:cytochrome c-type biogenesis protein CcmH